MRLPNLIRSYLIAIFTALIVTTMQLLILLIGIRRNLFQAFRGDDSEILRRDSSQNVDYTCESIHFAGLLIGYVLWGYLLIAFFLMIVGVIIDIIITSGVCSSASYVTLFYKSVLIREHLYGTTTIIRCSKTRWKWYLAIFLLKNLTVIYRRKRYLVWSHTDETRMLFIGRKK